jgi:hypothetical protein
MHTACYAYIMLLEFSSITKIVMNAHTTIQSVMIIYMSVIYIYIYIYIYMDQVNEANSPAEPSVITVKDSAVITTKATTTLTVTVSCDGI